MAHRKGAALDAPILPGEFDDSLTGDDVLKSFAASIVSQAIQDARRHKPLEGVIHSYEIAEARAFLMDDSGSWSKSREMWCAFAGIDADAVKAKALKLLMASPRSNPKHSPASHTDAN